MKRRTFSYGSEAFKELMTNFKDGATPLKFALEKMNEIGAQGKRVVSFVESQEPSPLSTTAGGRIPYYVITLITEAVVTVDVSEP